MKKLFRLLVSASAGLLLFSCQPQAKPEAVARVKAPAGAAEMPSAAEVIDGARPLASLAATQATAPIADAATFLASNNLAPLWQADFGQHENQQSRPTILDGFYGAEHRHISVILERVQRDAAQPNVFRVQGRTRYKKNITPFDGTITVDVVKPLKAFLDLDSVEEASARSYTATARFELREDPATNGAGTYQGTAQMDFYRLASGKLDLIRTLPDTDLPTGGGGLLFRGQWMSVRTGRRQAVAFATYAQAVLPDALKDLYIGERDETLNPKYAGLDWSEAWENEEWWAKPAKPSLSL
jgi:hypothetical protein